MPDHLLNFPRRNILSTPNDHFFYAPCDIQKIPSVQMSHIAGMEPSVRVNGLCRFFRQMIIALHDIVATHADFSVFPCLQAGSVRRQDPYLAVAQYPSCRCGTLCRRISHITDADAGCGFRLSVRCMKEQPRNFPANGIIFFLTDRRAGNDAVSQAA